MCLNSEYINLQSNLTKDNIVRIAVSGSRNFNNKKMLYHVLDIMQPTEIISGGAIGADTFAEEYAKEKGIKFTCFLPEYDIYGR